MAREKLRSLLKERTRTSNDLFHLLPADVAFHLFSYLSTDDIIALMGASLLIHPPKIILKHPIRSHNFFTQKPTITTLDIPMRPDAGEDPLEDTFVTQLHDGRLIYCYANGSIELFSAQTPVTSLDYLPSLLPKLKTVGLHELRKEQVVVCFQNHETYYVDLQNKIVTKLNLPQTKMSCAFYDSKTSSAFFGMKDGKLIQWDLDKNELMNIYSFATAEKLSPKVISNTYLLDIKKLYSVEDVPISQGLPIRCISRNIDGQLYLVLEADTGYLACCFNPNTLAVKHIRFCQTDNDLKAFYKFARIFYTRFGEINIVSTNKTNAGSLNIQANDSTPCQNTILNEDSIPQASFTFPNGLLVFSGYQSNHSPLKCQLEIHGYATPKPI